MNGIEQRAAINIDHSDMKIVPLGSKGTILNFDWFLNYSDIKLVIQESEKKERMICSYCKQSHNSVINEGNY